jgi:hypothetical protein
VQVVAQLQRGHVALGTAVGHVPAAGLGGGHTAVGMEALAVAQVLFQLGHRAQGDVGAGLAAHTRELAFVPRSQGDGVGAHLLAGAPGGDGVAASLKISYSLPSTSCKPIGRRQRVDIHPTEPLTLHKNRTTLSLPGFRFLHGLSSYEYTRE